MYRYFKGAAGIGTGNYIYFWKSKGLSDENITAPTTSDYSLNPQLSYLDNKTRAEFKVFKSRQNYKLKIVNIYIVYDVSKNYNISSSPTLENCLFGGVSLTKNVDINKCKYSGYGSGFNRHGFFSHPSSGTGRNVIIFLVDMS